MILKSICDKETRRTPIKCQIGCGQQQDGPPLGHGPRTLDPPTWCGTVAQTPRTRRHAGLKKPRWHFIQGSGAMSISTFAKCWCTAAVAVGAIMAATIGGSQAQDTAPVNSGANPYTVIKDWAQLTVEKRPWGGSNGV